MIEIYVIRLAETENNAKQIWSGRRNDSPLTVRGTEQAKRIAELLSKRNISAIYSSPMPRVIESAQPLASVLEVEINSVIEFQEIDLGDFDGCASTEVKMTVAGQQFLSNPSNFICPGADESLVASQANAMKRLRAIVSDCSDNSSVAIYTHGGTMRLLLLGLLSASNLSMFWRFRTGNSALAHFTQKGKDEFELFEMLNFDGIIL